MRDKVTVPAISARKGGAKLTMVTAYDTPMAQIADQAGADIILVGDLGRNNCFRLHRYAFRHHG